MNKIYYVFIIVIFFFGCRPKAKEYRERGREKLNLKDYEGSINDYHSAIALDPNYADEYSNHKDAKYNEYGLSNYADDYGHLGDAKSNLHDYQGALTCYTRAIEIYPPDHDNYNKRGAIKFYLNDFPGAISDYTKSIDINLEFGFAVEPTNNDVMAYLNRGLAKARLQDYKGAIEDYTEVIAIHSESINDMRNRTRAYDSRGSAKFNLGDYEGAQADYATAIDITLMYLSKGIDIFSFQFSKAGESANQVFKNQPLVDGDGSVYSMGVDDYSPAIFYYHRGLSKNRIGQIDSGCLDFSKAGELGYALSYEMIRKHCNN